jgi:hypothetical protein
MKHYPLLFLCFILSSCSSCEKIEYKTFETVNNSNDTIFWCKHFRNDTNKILYDTAFIENFYAKMPPKFTLSIGYPTSDINKEYYINEIFHYDSVYTVTWKNENYDKLVVKRNVVRIDEIDKEITFVYP